MAEETDVEPSTQIKIGCNEGDGCDEAQKGRARSREGVMAGVTGETLFWTREPGKFQPPGEGGNGVS